MDIPNRLFIRVIQAMMRPSCLQMAGRRDMEKTNRMPKSGLLPEFSPRESDGPVAI